MGQDEYEWDITISAKNGVPIMPRYIDCPECGEPVRHRPGHVYSCADCGAVTTLIPPPTKP